MTKLRYGGDYNPEQWPAPVWEEDHRAFDLARVDTLTLNVFGWSQLQPDEDTYDFELLDQVVERTVASERDIVLATATGALPPWLAHQYPEVTRVDFEGRRHRYGQRHNHCPTSPVFRRLSAELAGRIAERYTGTPGLIAWHVGNEYGGPDGSCWCESCAAGFRVWLRDRYGSIDALNDAWNGAFWSHLFTDWEQVVPPNALSEHWRGPNHTAFQGITLDYRRFSSDALLRNYRDEKDRIREHDSGTPVTTNFMGAFRPIDYHRWYEHLDLVTWDNYPPGPREEARMAFTHALTRGIRPDVPMWVMEQTPTITAARDVNPVKRPGVLGLWSWQAVAHGADAVLYFQMRASRGACEKYHGAVLDHAGRTDTRPFREVAELGRQLDELGDLLVGSRVQARTALLFDWDSWWTTEMTDGFNRHVRYLDVVLGYHRALWSSGAGVDVLPVTADLDGYDVVVAPMLHVIKDDVAERLAGVAARGGSVVTSFWAGRVDASTNAFLMDAPGPLAATFGVRVEETDSAAPGVDHPIRLEHDGVGLTSSSGLVHELLVPEGAEVVGRYTDDFYAGRAAVTRHDVGDGEAWYVGTGLAQEGIDMVLGSALARHDLPRPVASATERVVRRTDHGDVEFLLDHDAATVRVLLHADGADGPRELLSTGPATAAGTPG